MLPPPLPPPPPPPRDQPPARRAGDVDRTERHEIRRLGFFRHRCHSRHSHRFVFAGSHNLDSHAHSPTPKSPRPPRRIRPITETQILPPPLRCDASGLVSSVSPRDRILLTGPPLSRETAPLSSCFPDPLRHLKEQYRGRAERRSRDGSCGADRRSHFVSSPGSQAPSSKKPWRALPPSPVW